MFEKKINELRNKLEEQDKILELNETVNNFNTIMSSEKKLMVFSFIITLFSLSIALAEFLYFRSPDILEESTEVKYIRVTNFHEKVDESSQLYGKLNSSKKLINVSSNNINSNNNSNNLNIKSYSEKIKNLSKEIIRLKSLVIDFQNQREEILLENQILISKNILLDKESKYNLTKLEEKLMALSSKTKIQNQKLSTAINMIDNLKLERVNLLSKLNLPFSNDSQLANYK